PGAATKLTASSFKVYVWIADVQLLELSMSSGGPGLDPSPVALRVDDPDALAALNHHATRHASSLGKNTRDPGAVVVNPPKLSVANGSGGIAGTISGDSMSIINTSTLQATGFVALSTGDAPNEIAINSDNTK